jgi:type II secretory pathway component PulC
VRRAWKRVGARVQIVLGLACMALAGLIYEELDRPAIEPAANAASARPTADQPVVPTAAPNFAMPLLRDYAEVTARPLFSETRRPPPEVSRGPPVQPSSFTLIGIIVSENGRHALIEHGQPPRLDRVIEGQEFQGWTIETILPGKVVIRHANTREDIKPKDKPARTPQQRPNQRSG